MSHFDEIGEYGLDQLLTKRLTTPGGAVAPTVAPELFPVIALESDRPEYGRLKGEQLTATRFSIGAVVGEYTMCQLYLPSTARAIAVVTKIQSGNATVLLVAQAVGISAGIAGWAAITNNPLDFRWTPQRSQVLSEYNNDVAQPANHGIFALIPASAVVYTSPIIISPGTALVIWGAATNVVMDVNVNWYERGAQPGELV